MRRDWLILSHYERTRGCGGGWRVLNVVEVGVKGQVGAPLITPQRYGEDMTGGE